MTPALKELAVQQRRQRKLHANVGLGPLCAQAVWRALRGQGVQRRFPGRGYIHGRVGRERQGGTACAKALRLGRTEHVERAARVKVASPGVDVNSDSTLRLVREHISCGGSSLLVGAEGWMVLREGRTAGRGPGPRTK